VIRQSLASCNAMSRRNAKLLTAATAIIVAGSLIYHGRDVIKYLTMLVNIMTGIDLGPAS
jgi:hypothetical protein